MSDEMQYRCAGFVQAEIERYADELESEKPPKEGGSDAGDQSDSGSELEDRPAGKGRSKGKNDEVTNGAL